MNMDFVGKTIRKEPKGIGVVKSFDSSVNLFEIRYESGDLERLGEMEVGSLVIEGDEEMGTVKPCSTFGVKKKQGQHNGGQSELGLIGGFDLNVDGFNAEEEGGFSLDVKCEEEEDNMKRTNMCIDLNVDAKGEFEESVMKDSTDLGVPARCFDLNMGLDEEVTALEGMKGEKENSISTPQVVMVAQTQETGGESDRKESKEFEKMGGESDSKDGKKFWFDVSEGARSGDDMVIRSYGENEVCASLVLEDHNGFTAPEDQFKEGLLEVCTPPFPDNQENNVNLGTERKLKRRKILSDSAETTLRRSRRLATGCDSSTEIVQNFEKQIDVCEKFEGYVTPGDVDTKDLMKSESKFSENGTPIDHSYQYSGSKRRGRKRKKIIAPLDNGGFATETQSRRISCRLMAQSSVAVDVVSKELFTPSDHQELEENCVASPKLKLPPSSDNLDLDGIPVLDFFSIYTCLRSFSTLLFLSPFNLEDFLAALKCNKDNMLLDSIHVSLLQTLRKHLELLSSENILYASNCLRNLNWDLLDSITWPVFVANYLLIHGSALKTDFDLTKLKLLDCEYYKQAAVVKLEILRCLYDDVIEVEAVRSELNQRTLATDPNMDIDRNIKTITPKRRKIAMDVVSESCLTEEIIDENADQNSDDCCLCKMDGSLICCDGCPAAYHMKCVGVSNNSLPDGDWYCPECVIDKDKPWLKMGKSLRGAEILGVDPYERIYYVCAGYVLVLDSCGRESSCHYYHRNDLTPLVEAMKSSHPLYEPILKSISNHLDIYVGSNGIKNNMSSHNSAVCLEVMKEQISTNSIPAQNSDNMECSYLAKSEKMETLLTSSEGSVETSQIPGIQGFPMAGSDVLIKSSVAISNDSEMGTIRTISDIRLVPENLYGELGNSTIRLGGGYINYYSFAHTSSMVLEELTRKSTDKNTVISTKTIQDIVSAQLKAITKRSTKFFWPMFQNMVNEKCGWCFACRAPDADDDSSRDCFFNQNVSDPQGFDELDSLRCRYSSEGHLVDVICYILCMEDRLRGLLLGPWQNPNYTKIWRQRVIEVSDVASLKYFLLMLEANLHHLVLSPEWIKHVDSVTTMGSASHIVTRISSKHGISRKRAQFSDVGPKLNAATGLGLLWWRGGRLSRELYNCKGLTRSLASKAARQAGCTKIEGLLYSESSDFTKRSRSIVWKSAVEASRTVEQLALQIRELDIQIRWDDIENTHPLSKLDQYKKSMRSFKKVIIRKKLIEGTVVKYLLDFGKRRFIPDIVITHGSIVEEFSSGRKKFWLEDTHVPLYLLKAFEERRIARKDNKMKSDKHHWNDKLKKTTSKRKGFSYLFAKAEQSKYYQCGHCDKDVLIREAVCCMHCKGHFHKRHVKKSPGSAVAERLFSCSKCLDGKFVKLGTKKGKKQVSHKSKNSPNGSQSKKKVGKGAKPAQKNNKKIDFVPLPLRRSPRKLKSVALPKKKVGKRKKGKAKKSKQINYTQNVSEKPRKSVWQKKRTQAYHAYWLNGILFSRKANDERVDHFMCKNIITSSVSMVSPPKCSLSCEQEFTPSLSYVKCEICEDWFHGDALGLTMEKMDRVIGFRCHKCRDRTSPICPHSLKEKNSESKSGEINTCNRNEEIRNPSNVENSMLFAGDEHKNEAVQCSKDDDVM